MYAKVLDDGQLRVFFGSGLVWESHHTVNDSTTQVDGRLCFPGHKVELDIYLTLDEEIREFDLDKNAENAWNNGSLLLLTLGVSSLVIPAKQLTTQVVEEAFRRLFA